MNITAFIISLCDCTTRICLPLKKEIIRDLATNALRTYAYLNRPTARELKERIKRKGLEEASFRPLIADIKAVNKTLKYLKANEENKIILEAVEAVYFTRPKEKLNRTEIINRCGIFAVKKEISERKVYNYLKTARRIYAKYN